MRVADAEVAVAAALAGAAVVRARYGMPLARFDKSPLDFATDADIDAERAILSVLREQCPDDEYQGEELGTSGNSSSERAWLIDPLCGTLNFAARTPIMVVNVALRDGGDVRVAAAADPLAAEVFWTDGHAARVRRDGEDTPLVPSAGSHLIELNLNTQYADRGGFQAVRMLADTDFAQAYRPRVLSTSLALAWVADGRRAAYVTDGDLRGSVHFASGIALCQAAGCVVTGLRGQPVCTGADGMVAAADGETHAALMAVIGRQFDSH